MLYKPNFTRLLFILLLVDCCQLYGQSELGSRLLEAQNDSVRVKIYLDWIGEHKTTSKKQCLAYALEAFELVKKLDVYREEVMLTVGEMYWLNQNPDKALIYYQGAKDLVLATSHKEKMAKVFLELGRFYEERDKYDSAFSCYATALKSAEEMQQASENIEALVSIGRIYEFQRLGNGAIRYFLKARNLALSHGFTKVEADICLIIGSSFRVANKYDSALKYLLTGLELFTRLNDYAGMAKAYNNLGITHRNIRNFKEALTYFEMARTLNQKQGDSVILADNLINIGSTYALMGSYYNATVNLEQGRRIAEERGLKRLLMVAYKNLQEIYYSQGQFEKSLLYARKLNVLNEYLYNLSITEALAEMRIKFETELKERENQHLRLKEQQDQQIIDSQKKTIFLSVAAMIILISLLMVVVVQYRAKQKANRLLALSKIEIEKAHSELKTQNEELRNINKIKDMLLSVVSHDLRSPLHSVEGMLQLMAISPLTQKELSTLAKDLSFAVGQSLNLLDNLLSWAKSQMKGFEIKKVLVEVEKLVHETAQLFQHAIESKGNRLEIHIPASLVVLSDPDVMRLVIRNFINNANKFTSHGQIVVSAVRERQQLRIVVSDNGIGIPEYVQQRLKEGQTIESQKGTGAEIGSGLGLMLCRTLAEKAGASIEFESVEGKGSSFALVLPL